jgi:hypothetical protein
MGNIQNKTAAVLAAVAGLAVAQFAAAQTIFYSESFDSAVLNSLSGDPRVVDVCVPSAPVFTHVPPSGWTWTGCGVSSYDCRVGGCPPVAEQTCSTCGNLEGVFEWEGWSFANKTWWAQVAGNQGRADFALASGVVAVADPDEWDDKGNPDANCGTYNTFMTTPTIDISSIDAGSLSLSFVSSWRDEGFDDSPRFNNQTAKIKAIYTLADNSEVIVDALHWDSDNRVPGANPFFHNDNTNEAVDLDQPALQVPGTAQSVRFEFSLTLAENDWFWAVDNIALVANVAGAPSELFFEDFESVTLLPPVDERTGCGLTYCNENTFTHTGPNGVTVSQITGTGGVPDWKGWSFVNAPFWQCVDDQGRGQFTNGTGIIAVADSDEFDDLADAGGLITLLTTPSINIAARTSNVLVVAFDSSWRNEDGQTASVVAEFNNGTVVNLINWDGVPGSPNNKPDATNELVAVALVCPVQATSVVLKFNYTGNNNWWWAIDDVALFEGTAVAPVVTINPSQNNMGVAPNLDYAACFTPWSPSAPADWFQAFAPRHRLPRRMRPSRVAWLELRPPRLVAHRR